MTTIPIVTATDYRYLPGVFALYNSYLRNSQDGFSFHVLAYGDDSLKSALEEKGIDVILNKHIPVDSLPMSPKYSWYRDKIESSAMYARLMIPELFPGKKSVYIDADAVILRSLAPIVDVNFREHPCAGTAGGGTVEKSDVPGSGMDFPGIMASLIVFNHEWWNKKDIYNKCLRIMVSEKYIFQTVVQGVLNYALNNDFLHYAPWHQVHGGHQTAMDYVNKAYVLHFI